ncbi:unnamed protein product, partial [Ixodes hexagonus]
MADPDVLVSSLASAAALAASGYLFAVGVGRIKVMARGAHGTPAMVSRFDSSLGRHAGSRSGAPFSSMMEDGTGDEPPTVAPYDGRFHDEDDVMDGDYDSRDFIVHRNTFNSVDDYNSEDSTTHGSPQSDSLRWRERPPERHLLRHDPNDRRHSNDVDDDRRSPDYASSEDEADYRVDYVYEDEDSPDFVDNSDAYATDPRRYVYYPEEKELEVIPEEDEEELREQAGSREDAASDCSYGGKC